MKQIYVIILFLALAGYAHAADRVQNVKATQQGNRALFEYDLTGDKPATVSFDVTVKGQKLAAESLHLEGDYGKNVAPGRRRLVWNVLQDYPRGLSGEVEWSLTAGGGGGSDPTTGMEFVEVPEGCFRMGDLTGDGGNDEKPVHEVCVDGFSMGKYEVKVGEFRKFVSSTGYRTDAEKGDGCYTIDSGGGWSKKSAANWNNPGFDQTDDHPAVCISHNDAVAFSRWLSRQSGRPYRLPTEAEWEYAARGGTASRNYWGNGKDEACGFANVADRTARRQFGGWATHDCDDGYLYTAPAGSFRPNGFGLYDMMGNAWEWCGDWYGEKYYGDSPRSNPLGPSSGTIRVNRGGGWNYGPANVRASHRNFNTPGYRGNGLGFRLVSPVQ